MSINGFVVSPTGVGVGEAEGVTLGLGVAAAFVSPTVTL